MLHATHADGLPIPLDAAHGLDDSGPRALAGRFLTGLTIPTWVLIRVLGFFLGGAIALLVFGLG
jgi:hypothetical protein